MPPRAANPWQPQYLESILANLRNSNEIADSRANFLVGISGFILSISLAQLLSVTGTEKTAFLVIAVFSFLTVFITIGVIRPKIGKPSETNTMYHMGILRFGRKAYEKELLRVVGDEGRTVREYAEEIYDFSEELRGRFRMIRLAADLLAVGLASGIVLLVLF